MPSPTKHPSVRARMNKSSTRAVLTEPPEDAEIPSLPVRLDCENKPIPYEKATEDWWDAIWLSPMRSEFHKSDVHGLYRLADLVDAYWGGRGDRIKLAAEIRLTQKDFGLTPMDRRRLEWTIESAEKAKDSGDQRREYRQREPKEVGDPRLSLVSSESGA